MEVLLFNDLDDNKNEEHLNGLFSVLAGLDDDVEEILEEILELYENDNVSQKRKSNLDIQPDADISGEIGSGI